MKWRAYVLGLHGNLPLGECDTRAGAVALVEADANSLARHHVTIQPLTWMYHDQATLVLQQYCHPHPKESEARFTYRIEPVQPE